MNLWKIVNLYGARSNLQNNRSIFISSNGRKHAHNHPLGSPLNSAALHFQRINSGLKKSMLWQRLAWFKYLTKQKPLHSVMFCVCRRLSSSFHTAPPPPLPPSTYPLPESPHSYCGAFTVYVASAWAPSSRPLPPQTPLSLYLYEFNHCVLAFV